MHAWLRIFTDHGPIRLLQVRLAVEADVEPRDEGAYDLDDDGDVVEAEPQGRVRRGMAQQGVERRGDAEAERRGREVEVEHRPVGPGRQGEAQGEMPRQEPVAQQRRGRGDEMRVDVDGLVVAEPEALQAPPHGMGDGPVPREDVVRLVPRGHLVPGQQAMGRRRRSRRHRRRRRRCRAWARLISPVYDIRPFLRHYAASARLV